MAGYVGTVLYVDLTRQAIIRRPLPAALVDGYLGGRGINSRLVYDALTPDLDPLGPGNPLVFGAGPLVGTPAPGAGRYTVSSKSPLTGLFADANAGGHFGPELKFAGFDHLVITGALATPGYLYVADGKAEIRPAQHLWGLDTWQTEDQLRHDHGDDRLQVACIGPAGENRVRMACIINNKSRAAGRTGLGAVMGAKRLKAVAVRGTGAVPVADPEAILRLTAALTRRIKAAFSYALMSEYGTQNFVMGTNFLGALVIRHWSRAVDFDQYRQVCPETIRKKHYVKRKGCFACPIACGHLCEVRDGEFAGERGEGLEHGVTTPFGIGCGISDTNTFIRFNNLCNRYGVDALEFGLLTGAAMEWFEKGLITPSDLDGRALEWGDHRGVLQLLEDTVRRQGFGAVLALGGVKAAEQVGGDAAASLNHVKGLSWGADDVRPFKGYALALATSTRGADHLRGMPTEEIFYSVTDPSKALSYDKADLVILYQRLNTLADALGLCKFTTQSLLQAVGLEDMAAVYHAVTGREKQTVDLVLAADRIYDLERAMHVKDGVTRRDDLPQGKWAEEPVPDGPFRGERLDKDAFNRMLDDFYRKRGWDVATGAPRPSSGAGTGRFSQPE